jgi:hypothetical protein
MLRLAARRVAVASRGLQTPVLASTRSYHENVSHLLQDPVIYAFSPANMLQVIDHYENPRNVGALDKTKTNVGTGLVGAPACGDVMKLQVPRCHAGAVVLVAFNSDGCRLRWMTTATSLRPSSRRLVAAQPSLPALWQRR